MSLSFGKKLKNLRESRQNPKITLGDIAELLDVGPRQVQRYENDFVPELDKILKLSDYFKYDFLSHITGGKCAIINSNNIKMADETDYKDKYIKLLETNLKEFRVEFEANRGLLQELYRELKEHRDKTETNVTNKDTSKDVQGHGTSKRNNDSAKDK